LTALKTAGVTPEWVQVGNETNNGMLWPEGKASTNMANFAALVNKGYDAVKAVDPSIKVIVHISNGNDNSLFRWIFDGLKNNGGKWDIIAMSLYPDPGNWANMNNECLTNINDMIARYGKPVIISEVGMSWDQPAACQSFLSDLINKVKAVPGNYGLGVFYWEPQSYGNWQGYTKGAFDNSGKPTIALNAFN
jgi:arabinogalactan endo-1,4-beta-galactosidase